MATYGAKRPARKLPPKAAVTPAIPAMTAAEAAPAMPLTDIAAAPLAAIPPADAVVIAPPAPAVDVDPVEAPVAETPAIESPVGESNHAAHDAAVDSVIDTIDATPVAADLVSDTDPITTTTHKESIMDVTTATTAATEKTQAFFADASERTQGAVEKSTKFFQEVTEFSKGNVEAIVESSKIAARGFETLGQDAAAYAKTSFESASQAMRTMASLKSPTEFLKFQADYVRSSFDALVAQTSRGTEASLKLAGDVAQPISNRVAVAAEKMKVVA